jgi:molecular chaperone DnaK
VFQGERDLVEHNHLLGRFDLDGIDPAPRGAPQIDVTFDIDANGILQVSARERASGREQRVNVTGASRLAPDEIERMVAEAQQHAAEDLDRRERIQARNAADALVYQAERFLVQVGDGLPADDRHDLETKVMSVRSVIDGADTARIRAAAAALRDTLLELNPGASGSDNRSESSGAGATTGSDQSAGQNEAGAAGADGDKRDATEGGPDARRGGD